MAPNLIPGQVVVVWASGRAQVGDVVMARVAGREVVKRLVSEQGQAVVLYGDNPSASTDSRTYGAVSRDDIVGKVIWPRIEPLESLKRSW